jgi:hypothetical protein
MQTLDVARETLTTCVLKEQPLNHFALFICILETKFELCVIMLG